MFVPLLPIWAFLKGVPWYVYAGGALLAYMVTINVQKANAVRALNKQRAQIEQQAAQQTTQNRATEHALTEGTIGVANELAKARNTATAAARTSEQRLRKLAADWAASAASASAGTPCRDDGAPIAGVLRDEDRAAFVALGEEAQRDADKLRACQAYVKNAKRLLP